MLQRAGGVKVLDFGIAQATNGARPVETGGGRVKGKLAYLSPEQVRLQELDGRSDVFALGVVLWERLVGRRLFPGENDFLTMRNVLSQPVPVPSSIRPEVPAALDAIVARALEREREQRYPTAQAMADELERFLQQAPCHSQAIPRLLQELFGEEATDQTPDLPTLAVRSVGCRRPRPRRLRRGVRPGPLGRPPREPDADEGPVVEMEALPDDGDGRFPGSRRCPACGGASAAGAAGRPGARAAANRRRGGGRHAGRLPALGGLARQAPAGPRRRRWLRPRDRRGSLGRTRAGGAARRGGGACHGGGGPDDAEVEPAEGEAADRKLPFGHGKAAGRGGRRTGSRTT